MPEVKTVYWLDNKHPISLVDTGPNNCENVLVCNLPMGNDLNDHMRLFIMVLQVVFLNHIIIASENLAEPRQNYGKFIPSDIYKMKVI